MSKTKIIVFASILVLVHATLLTWYFYRQIKGDLTVLDLSMVVINAMSLSLNIHTILTSIKS